MKEHTAIIGAGAFGNAISALIKKDEQVLLWDVQEGLVEDQLPLEEVVSGARAVFLCVPSWGLRSAARELPAYIEADTPVVCPTKGIEQDTYFFSDQVLEDVFGSKGKVCMLMGPMLAAEIRQGLPSFATLACAQSDTYERVAVVCKEQLKMKYSDDVRGVAACGVLKNAYAMGLGMLQAMELGSNARGWYVQTVLEEMPQLVRRLGGKEETVHSYAGVADLIATGFSPHSRNCRAGSELVISGECTTVSEGEVSLPLLFNLIKKDIKHYPVLRALCDIIVSGSNASKRMQRLLYE